MNQEKPIRKNEKGFYGNRRNLPELTGLRKPPAVAELENAVLGAILTEGNSTMEKVLDMLHVDNPFYETRNATLWGFMLELNRKSISCDLISVASECMASDELSEIWSPYELTKLSTNVTSSADIEGYCRKIQECHLARRTIELANTISRRAYEDDVFDVLESAESGFFDLTVGKIGNDYKSAAQIANERMAAIVDHLANPKKLTGVPTGINSLDVITGGWQKSDLIILAARPGLGKTAFALNLAMAAAKSGAPVGIFTLEMADAQLMNRLLSMESKVPLSFIRKGDVTDSQVHQISAAADKISGLPIFIDEEGGITLFNLRSKARKMKTKNGIQLLIVDYLQLMTNPAAVGNREREISSISQGLKAMAKSLDIPIIALSQLSRAVETRGGKSKPQLSDLRESGSIEQDANMVLFLSRADYGKTDGEVDPSLANTAELAIAKNRDGELREIALNTDLSIQMFYEPSAYFEGEPQQVVNPYAAFSKSEFDPKDQFLNTEEKAPF